MFTHTKVTGESLIDFLPSIYMLQGPTGCFSMKEQMPLLTQASSACLTPNITHSTSIQFCNIPAPERTEKYALYEFSLAASKIPSVKAVTYQIEGDVIIVWTFIRRRDKVVRSAIYEMELDLMDKYPSMVFDFNVISLENFSDPLVPHNVRGTLVFFRDINGD